MKPTNKQFETAAYIVWYDIGKGSWQPVAFKYEADALDFVAHRATGANVLITEGPLYLRLSRHAPEVL